MALPVTLEADPGVTTELAEGFEFPKSGLAGISTRRSTGFCGGAVAGGDAVCGVVEEPHGGGGGCIGCEVPVAGSGTGASGISSTFGEGGFGAVTSSASLYPHQLVPVGSAPLQVLVPLVLTPRWFPSRYP
jgi:hypothetical protein